MMKTCMVALLSLAITGTSGAFDQFAPSSALRGGYDWSGAYVGGHVGYGWGGATNDYWDPGLLAWATDGDISYNSLVGGLHIGFQQQFSSLVAGVEADFSLSRYKGDDSMVAGRINEIAINSMGSLRGRLGVVADKLLIYGTAGLALAQFEKTDLHGGVPANAQWAGGWVAGGGAEMALDSNWVIRAEYLHTRLNDIETGINVNDPPVVGSYTHRANAPTINVLRVGANYRF